MSDYYASQNDDDDLPLIKLAATVTLREKAHRFVKRTTKKPSQEKLLLEILTRKKMSTREVETFIHRGQAVIGVLKELGHLIETVTESGQEFYVHKGYSELLPVGKHKQLYYTTKHWRRLAYERKKLDCFCCKQCGSKEALEVHHHVYNLFEEDVLRDLITFCSGCHQRVHEGAKKSKLHFPKTLPQSILDRIKADQVTTDGAESWN